MRARRVRTIFFLMTCVTTTMCLQAGQPQLTAFTYQGQLKQGGAPANGEFEMAFALHGDPLADSPVGPTLFFDGMGGAPDPIAVMNGLFTVELDFGLVFDGSELWLEISVRPAGDPGPYTTLSPRQKLTAAPLASFALSGGSGGDGHSLDGAKGGPEDALFVDSAGNVGIGTTTPMHQLEVIAPAGDVFQVSGPTDLIAYGAWKEATGAAAWSGRFEHASVVHAGKMWVLGGVETGATELNDVWSSTTGAIWTRETAAAAWGAREGLTCVVHDGKMWVIAGRNFISAPQRDVWSSDDGINWVQATTAAPWTARSDHASVVYNGNIWILGGAAPGGAPLNDVWSSPDGVKWTQATADAAWAPRFGHSALVHDGRIWIFGGRLDGSVLTNDVWSSADGATWELETAAAPWEVRWDHTSVVHDGNMWVIGGDVLTAGGAFGNDVWYSPDGINWTQQTAEAEWGDRRGHASVDFDGSVWVIGGVGIDFNNDVWSLTGAPSAAAVLRLTAEGRLGIGTTVPAHPLEVGTDETNGNGAHVTAGGIWTNGSDRAAKKNFRPIDPKAILAKVGQLPITRWQFRGEEDSIQHIGPVAQDFYAAFGLGGSDKHIGTSDADGVALAAIQALYQLVDQKNAQIAALRAEMAELRLRVSKLAPVDEQEKRR